MKYGIDYDLNVRNSLYPETRTATITIYNDIPYSVWNSWYKSDLQPNLINMDIHILSIQRHNRRKLISGIKYGLDKFGNIRTIIDVNNYAD